MNSTSAPSAAEVQRSFLSLDIPAGAPAMTPISFWAEEAISTPFLVTIEATADDPNIDPTEFLYRPVCLILSADNGPTRYFNGIVRRFVTAEARFRVGWAYVMEVVPRLWFMSQTTDSRIFQHQSLEDIIKTLLQEAGVPPAQWRVNGDKPVHDYTTQMNETDLDFVSRLMQQEGWFYFFQHSRKEHTLIVTDYNGVFQDIPNPECALGTSQDLRVLRSWSPFQATTYGKTKLKDYDPTVPNKHLEATKDTIEEVAGAARRDFFRWPALTFVPDQVDHRTRIVLEAAEANASLIAGMGQHNGFVPGGKFILEKDPYTQQQDKEYVIRSVVHQGSENIGVTGGWASSYGNSFTCFPENKVWRERLTIPRPQMFGIYSATVIGHKNEEIFTDRFGRVKVLFKWDHRKDSTADLSVWLRVIQPWAGKNWGWQFLPRVDTEVAVAFVDGDVDRPIVVGGVYNGDYMPPFPLPHDKNRSGIETRSTPMPRDAQGNPTGKIGYHMLRFDDSYGKEQFLIRSQRRLDITALEKRYESIGSDRHLTVGGKNTDPPPPEIGGDYITKVFRHYYLHVGDPEFPTQSGNRSTKLEQSEYIHVVKDSGQQVDGNWSVTTDGQATIDANGIGGTIVLNATTNISLSVGSSSIVITPSTIAITAPMVLINSGGPPPATPIDAAEIPLAEPIAADPGDSRTSPKS